MANKSIKSRYSIEYAYPDASEKNKSNKKWPLIVAGLIGVGALSSAVIPFRSIESFITTKFSNSNNTPVLTNELANESIQTAEPAIIKKANLTQALNDLNSDFLVETVNSNAPTIEEVEVAASEEVVEVIEIDVEKLLLDNKKQQEVAQERLTTNNELTKKLNELTRQLTAEKHKNKKLNAQINAHEDNNSKLTSLLKNALVEASSEDQKYLAELNNLGNSNESTSSNVSNKTSDVDSNNNNTANIDITAAINNQVAQLLPSTSATVTTKIDHNNSISISTASQVDAIILAMQEIQQNAGKPTKSSVAKNTIKVDTTPVTKNESSEELLHVRLQRQINEMLTISDEKSSTYKKALKKESAVRENAMRSIIVKKGETLWSIAKRAYGNGSLYTKIIEANPHIAKNGKVVLSIGQVIRVPI